MGTKRALDEDGLNPKQRAFVEEYLKTRHMTNSAITAGYSKKTAEVQGSKLLSHPKIIGVIDRLREKMAARHRIDQDFIVKKLLEAHGKSLEPETVYDKDGNPVGERWAHAPTTTKSLELLGKTCGAYTEQIKKNIELAGSVQVSTEGLEKLTFAEIRELRRLKAKMES